MQFLRYTGKDRGNQLETELYRKLLDIHELTRLQADALMYFHVYVYLVALSKSNDLGKSVMDMNQHYLELQIYLQEVKDHPEVVLNRSYQVLQSEAKLYGPNRKTNHRYHKAVYIRQIIRTRELIHPSYTYASLWSVQNLCTYAATQLPGGEYWEPEAPVRKLLLEIKPSNDYCESVLVLSDYLTGAIPNLSQVGRSNLVAVKINHTMQWLSKLPDKEQSKVLDLAVKERRRAFE